MTKQLKKKTRLTNEQKLKLNLKEALKAVNQLDKQVTTGNITLKELRKIRPLLNKLEEQLERFEKYMTP